MIKTKANKFKIFLLSNAIVIAVGLFFIFAFISIAYISTPLNVEALETTKLGVEIYGEIAQDTPIYYSGDRKIISYEYLQPHTIQSFIAIEDKRFFNHNGYDLKRIVKAGIVNFTTHSKSQGASTITQQLVKNTLLNSEKTYSRKVKEIMLAIKTEKNFSKEEILNMYLNSIYFGSNAYGIESASNLYFNKSASELTINESAILAGIIKSPAYYSPINHPENCIKRKNIVLKQMLENNFISPAQYEENISLGLNVCNFKSSYDNSYNQQVIIEACGLLNISEKELLRRELKIYTYLDEQAQANLQNALNESEFNLDKLSLIVNSEGEIIAYSGDSHFDLSNMKRNPASTIKPLLIYLPAIATNIVSPASPILDEKIEDDYSPKNAGNSYLGWITIREALAHSSNVCAVKLLDLLGYDLINEFGNKLNIINSPLNNKSLALGDIGNGISILDLARAYSILQNNGKNKYPTFIHKIEDKNGNVIYSNLKEGEQIFKEEDCMLVNDMLKTCATSGTAKRLSDLPYEVASKTGTSQINGKNNDLWNIAYTTEHLIVTWCGDATSKGLGGGYSSSFYPTMINKSILKSLYKTYTPKPFALNDNILKIGYDSIEWKNNHQLYLSTKDEPERYILYDLFKTQNIPSKYTPTFESPNFNFNAKLTNKGSVISLNYNPSFKYEVFSKSPNEITKIGEYLGENIIDDKVFKYQFLEYFVKATNVYNNKIYISDTIYINPEEYLVNMLNNDFINKQSTKNKWYI